ncbi:MAG: heme ABC transporter ATP-binding protein [Halioglobus sp.]
MMNVLSLDQVTTAPWGTTLLQNIDLKLDEGEILGIIGPNGAGKTSLLYTLLGDILPTQGSIDLMGKPIDDWKPGARAEVVASLPQFSLLNFPYTVEEVIMLGRTPHGTGLKADRHIIKEVMKATDTARLETRIYTQLSGGEKQRVQIARVFAQIWREEDRKPRLLLLDEPTVALDLAHQQLILQSLKQLSDSGCSIVVVSHDFNLMTVIADKITALRDGVQLAHGLPASVLTESIFDRVFDAEVSITSHPVTKRPVVISL